MTLPEVDLRPGVPGDGSDIREWPVTATWAVPRELLEERGLQAEDLVILKAPGAVPGHGIRAGDRLLVDAGGGAGRPGAGIAVVCGARGCRVVEVPGMRAVIVGRVVGRWSWLP